MMNSSIDKGRIEYRSGTRFAMGVTIDGFLSENDVTALYERWDSKWAEPYKFPGGVKMISCEMVRDVPLNELVAVYGKSMASRLVTVARKESVL